MTFLPAGAVESYRDGESLFDIGRRAGVAIETACVGQGTCGLCRVRVVEGEQFLGAYTDAEQKHLGNVYFLTKVRLSCRTVAAGGDVVVELAPVKPRKSARATRPRAAVREPDSRADVRADVQRPDGERSEREPRSSRRRSRRRGER